MAIIKAVSSRASISKAVGYVTQEIKTEVTLVTGIECSPATAIQEMKATKEMWNKTDGRQYKHFVHSFSPDEKITHEKAHELAVELCKNRFKGHEVIIATHHDTDHVHSHIIVNSVNYETGHKISRSKQDLQEMKDASDELCRANGLSVTVKKDNINAYNTKKYKALVKGINGEAKSYVVDCYKAVSHAKGESINREDFVEKMKDQGYEVDWSDTRKNITFTDPQGKKIRNSNLEKTFKEPLGKEIFEHEFEINVERASERRKGKQETSRAGSLDSGKGIGNFQDTIGETGNALNAEQARRDAEELEEIRRREQEEREREATEREREAGSRQRESKGFEIGD